MSSCWVNDDTKRTETDGPKKNISMIGKKEK